MMFLQDGQYPNVGRVIRTVIPHYEATHPLVFAALAEMLDKDYALAREILTPGRLPRVIVTRDIQTDCILPTSTASGCFCPKTPRYIYIPHDSQAQAFENGGRAERFFIGALLHEAVHWGRYKKGIPRRFFDIEAGGHFEYLAGLIEHPVDHWNKKPRSIDDI